MFITSLGFKVLSITSMIIAYKIIVNYLIFEKDFKKNNIM